MLTDIQRAARFFYIQKLTFGGKVSGKPIFGTSAVQPARLNLLRLEEDLSAVHLRLARVLIERQTWSECLRRYDRPGTFFFADPPYWKTEGYGIDFPWSEYELLRESLETAQGKILITLGAHPDVVDLFGGFIHSRIGIDYTIGSKAKKAEEIIISNYLQ